MREKVLQFGTGILLRGLPDYFIDKANRAGIFNGKILAVKSTGADVTEFADRGNKFHTYIRGIENGRKTEDSFMNESVSRVLSAVDHWPEILQAAVSTDLQVIISNTTEVGLQYCEESIFQSPPSSFPAKLTAFLYERFTRLGEATPVTVIIPTELIPDNGEKLKSIVAQLIAFNQLPQAFSEWLARHVCFCSSLVDRIVTRPSELIRNAWKTNDPLAIQTEPYRLWAIEGDDRVREILSFHKADDGVIISSNIEYYRERKLRLLNGTHTISVCHGFLKGHNTVFECMEDPLMHYFIESVMMDEILPTIRLGSVRDLEQFGKDVLDRFRNPFAEHKLLSITFQATMKMRMRNIPSIVNYFSVFNKVPFLLAQGFSAYLLFMKSEKFEDGKYYGKRGTEYYLIQDDEAAYFHTQWNRGDAGIMVQNICSDTRLWATDLSALSGFTAAVTTSLLALQATR